MNTEPVAILVSSHDEFKDIWPIWDKCFDRFWPDCPYKIYWMTNGAETPVATIPVHVPKIPREQWGLNIAKALESVEEEYIIHWIEEVIPLSPINTDVIDKMRATLAVTQDVAAINLARYYHWPEMQQEDFAEISRESQFPSVSAMPSLIRKEILMKLLKERPVPNEYEQNVTKDFNRLYPDMKVLCPTFPMFKFCDNLLQFGKWRRCAVQHMVALGLTHLMDASRGAVEDECAWMNGSGP